MEYTLEQLKENKETWTKATEEYEKKMVETSNEGV